MRLSLEENDRREQEKMEGLEVAHTLQACSGRVILEDRAYKAREEVVKRKKGNRKIALFPGQHVTGSSRSAK
jgi:hypothetical protein